MKEKVERPVFGTKEVADRLDSVLSEMRLSNDFVAEDLKQVGVNVTGETVRKARKGLNQTIAHDLLAGIAVQYGVDFGWLIFGKDKENPAPLEGGRDASPEPIGNEERLYLARLAHQLQGVIMDGPPKPKRTELPEEDERLEEAAEVAATSQDEAADDPLEGEGQGNGMSQAAG